MFQSVRRNGIVALLSCGVATATLAGSEPILQGIALHGAASTGETRAAEWKANLGVTTECAYGLPFELSAAAVPDRLALGDVSPYLSDLYRALWGPGYKYRRGTPRGVDSKDDERQRFLEEYHDAIATPDN